MARSGPEGERETQGDAATQRMMAETYHPLARIGQPDEVARAILYLCANATFTTLPVDGGWLFRS